MLYFKSGVIIFNQYYFFDIVGTRVRDGCYAPIKQSNAHFDSQTLIMFKLFLYFNKNTWCLLSAYRFLPYGVRPINSEIEKD